MNKPLRRFQLTLSLGGDDMESIRQSLKSILWDLEEVEERPYVAVSGSPSAGYSIDLQFNPDVTHETYHEHLKKYLRKDKSADPPPTPDALLPDWYRDGKQASEHGISKEVALLSLIRLFGVPTSENLEAFNTGYAQYHYRDE